MAAEHTAGEPYGGIQWASYDFEDGKQQSSEESSREAPETKLFVGYKNGFVIANRGEAELAAGEFPFLMRINSWSQLRHTMFDSDGPNPDQNTFSFERLRLLFSGHVVSPDLTYFLQIDGNSDRTDNVFLDYFLTYDIGREWCGCEAKRIALKAGKWKVPFNRTRRETGRHLQFADRSTSNVFFDLNRSIGVGLFGKFDVLDLPLLYETAVFNGFRSNNTTSTSRDGGLDRNLGWSLRTQTDWFPDFGQDGEPDLNFREHLEFRLGGGVAYTRFGRDGASEFLFPRVVDSGDNLANLLPAAVSEFDNWLYTVDAHWKRRGWSLISEYYWRQTTQFNGPGGPSLLDHGFNLQSGYFVVPRRLELIARWSRIVGNSGTLGAMEQSSDEVGAGFVWYINGQNAKLTMNASHFNGAPVRSSRLDLLPGDIGWLTQTQLQVSF